MPGILLIDDNKNYSFGLAGNLRKAGFNVSAVSDGFEAIKLAIKMQPDLILCDVLMPAPDGMEIKRILNEKEDTKNIPFVFLSALNAANIKSKGLDIGAEDFIVKSVDMLELIARIQAVLRRKERNDSIARQEVQQLLEKLNSSLPIHTSHHFRTNLGILSMSLEMLSRNQSTDDDEFLSYARSSAYRMKHMMETLIWLNEFDLGRFETRKVELDLELSFVLPIREVIHHWAAKGIGLELDIEDGVRVFTPARSFSQAVCHLVDNACKFSPEGGQVTVQLCSDGPNGVQLTVSDDGPGVPPDMREKIFERFVQLESEVLQGLVDNHGMGLGLYMARSFARTQDGDVIVLDSARGCSVRMWLRA